MSLTPPAARAVAIGLAVHQAQALRLLTHVEADCNPDVPDVWWWREQDDVCVWAETWPTALAVPMLSEPAWLALDAGQGQWWVLNDQEAVAAVFHLNRERRLPHR